MFIILEQILKCFNLHLQDVTSDNIVLTPPFAVFPAYFILQNNEEITFQSLFFPFTYGMQVEIFEIKKKNEFNFPFFFFK